METKITSTNQYDVDVATNTIVILIMLMTALELTAEYYICRKSFIVSPILLEEFFLYNSVLDLKVLALNLITGNEKVGSKKDK